MMINSITLQTAHAGFMPAGLAICVEQGKWYDRNNITGLGEGWED